MHINSAKQKHINEHPIRLEFKFLFPMKTAQDKRLMISHVHPPGVYPVPDNYDRASADHKAKQCCFPSGPVGIGDGTLAMIRGYSPGGSLTVICFSLLAERDAAMRVVLSLVCYRRQRSSPLALLGATLCTSEYHRVIVLQDTSSPVETKQ
jgi:hypothetical protein